MTRGISTTRACAAAFALGLLFAPVRAAAADAPRAPLVPAVDTESRPLPGAPQGNAGNTPASGPDSRAAAGAGGEWADLAGVALPLALVVGLVLLCAAVLKRAAGSRGGLVSALAGGPAPAGLVQVLGRYPVARGQALVLLKVDRRVLLLSHTVGGGRAGSGGFATLAQFTDAEDVASILARADEADDAARGAGRTANARFHAALRVFESSAATDRDQGPAADVAADVAAGRRVVRGEAVRAAADCVSVWDERAGEGALARLAALRGAGAQATRALRGGAA